MYQCKDIVDEVNNYIDGELPLGKRVGLFFHLLICSCCRNYLQQIRSTLSIMTVSKPKEDDNTDTKLLAEKLHGIYKSHQH